MSYQVSVEGHHLSIVGQGIAEIPAELGTQYGETVTELDFTENAIRYDCGLGGDFCYRHSASFCWRYFFNI